MDDLLQEVFVNVFRSLPTYRGDAPLGAWVDRIAVRVAYAHISSRPPRMDPIDGDFDVPDDAPSAERTVAAGESIRRLYHHLDRMPPKLRIAFSLHVLDERPLSDVARLMDASAVATKARVWRARRELMARARRDTVLADLVQDLDDAEPSQEGRTA